MSKQIVYSCYVNRSREGEQFVPVHVLSYQISGALTFNDGKNTFTSHEGEFRFIRRNQLLKFFKQPPENGEFKTISVYLDEETLRSFSMEYGYTADKPVDTDVVIELKPNPLYKSYMQSLQPYEQLSETGNEDLMTLKLKEAILILLKANPELKNVLFDFSAPGKLDLEAFMQQNFHFNVEMKRFAYLTGRSLATFKRDFEKIFHSSPSRWLLQKRLQEAYYQIKEKGRKTSDVYLEVGFEDLSHFSFAFKKAFGVAPSALSPLSPNR
ncbi:helix-turn-helix domain-containing protein [Chitinophaga sp. 22321]|uniref:Helix-turn-helix transcriptional regulator n=1 Tax=Chitinophaga hostae TaxID=2831022 RepID=A0ABS5J6V8_9BACT|nr:AraC family transcriptional regulator [Chitinophaga hostae]MBS0030954.1 helix-turn-helix transcriptional regulator [Chitinophaga hostae]